MITESEPIKNYTVSFRIPENIISEIKKEAKTRIISTNSLITQILLQYVKWDKYEQRMRMYPVPKDCLQHIIATFDEVRRGEAIDIIYNAIRDWGLISKKKFDIHSCLEVLEDYCRMVGITIEETASEGLRSYVIRHDLGRNVSSLISDLIKKIFWEIVKIEVDTQITNTMVVARLRSNLD